MASPHHEDDAQNYHTLSSTLFNGNFCAAAPVRQLRFYLIQPSPNWRSFGIRKLMCYTLTMPATVAPVVPATAAAVASSSSSSSSSPEAKQSAAAVTTLLNSNSSAAVAHAVPASAAQGRAIDARLQPLLNAWSSLQKLTSVSM
jgi:hypothetical protein